MSCHFVKLTVFFFLIVGLWASSLECMKLSESPFLYDFEKTQNLPTSLVKIVFDEHTRFFYTVGKSPDNHSLVKIVSPHSLSHTELIVMYFQILPAELQRYITHLMINDVLDCNFEFFKNLEKSPFLCLAQCSPDVKNLLTVKFSEPPRLRDIETEKILGTLRGHTKKVTSLAFSPRGTTILTGSVDETARLWDTEMRTTLVIFQKGSSSCIRSVAYDPNGETVFIGSQDGLLCIYNKLSGELLLQLYCCEEALTSIEVSNDGKVVLIGSEDGKTVDLWDKAMTKKLFHVEHLKEIKSTRLSPNKKIILTTQKKIVHLWSVATKEQVLKLSHSHKIICSAFSPDSTLLLTGSARSEVCVWDLTSGVMVLNFICRTNNENVELFSSLFKKLTEEELLGEIKSVAFSSDAKTIFVGGEPNIISLWKIIPCEASTWILNETDFFQAHFILQAIKAKKNRNMLSLAEDAVEYKIFSSMPSYVQEYLKKFYF
ncbi:hypothetical protein H0X06_06420 [Candidatus Dependentiae bacterium]|nr:hypothetical protein [Candidatus Dependentiae bacterium]